MATVASGEPARGLDGEVWINGTKCGYIDSWDLPATRDEIEVTQLGQTAKEFLAGLASATISITGTFIWDDSQQEDLIEQFFAVDRTGTPAAISSAPVTLICYVMKGATSEKSASFQFDAASTALSVAGASGGVHTFSYDGRVSGDVTYVEETEA